MLASILNQIDWAQLRAYAISQLKLIILVAAIILLGQARAIDPPPTIDDVARWLPPDIEELVARNPPPIKYCQRPGDPLNVCLLPSMSEELFRKLDLITFESGAVSKDISDVSGTWNIEIQLDNLPRFSGKHKIDLRSSGGKISGDFYTEERTLWYGMEGKETAPGRIAFTLPISRRTTSGAPITVDYRWVDFVGDVRREHNKVSLVGTYTRFDRDETDGQIRRTTGKYPNAHRPLFHE